MNVAPMDPLPSAPTELRRDAGWSRQLWVVLILLAFAAHIGLIFALGDRKSVVPRVPAPAPPLRLLTGGDDWLALNDPTLFALPHPRGFAGALWLKLPRVEFPAFEWTEPPRWLPLPAEQLGGTFLRFMQTNPFTQLVLETRSAPALARPEPPADEFPPVTQSTVLV